MSMTGLKKLKIKIRLWIRTKGTIQGEQLFAKCSYCGVEQRLLSLTLDHVVAVSAGGKSNIENLVLSCGSCNVKKGSGIALWVNAAP
jgi:5-methylcytosine-specific restriction endonuclease McrA